MSKDKLLKNKKNKKRAKLFATLSLVGLAVVAIPAIVTPVVVTQKNKPKTQIPSNNDYVDNELDNKPELLSDDLENELPPSSDSDGVEDNTSQNMPSDEGNDVIDGVVPGEDSEPSGDVIDGNTQNQKLFLRSNIDLYGSLKNINNYDLSKIDEFINEQLSKKENAKALILNYDVLTEEQQNNLKITLSTKISDGLDKWGNNPYSSWKDNSRDLIFKSDKKLSISNFSDLFNYLNDSNNLNKMFSDINGLSLNTDDKLELDNKYLHVSLKDSTNQKFNLNIPISYFKINNQNVSLNLQSSDNLNEDHNCNVSFTSNISIDKKEYDFTSETFYLNKDYDHKTMINELYKMIDVANEKNELDIQKLENKLELYNLNLFNFEVSTYVPINTAGFDSIYNLSFRYTPKSGFYLDQNGSNKINIKIKAKFSVATWGDVSKYNVTGTGIIFNTRKFIDEADMQNYFSQKANTEYLEQTVFTYMNKKNSLNTVDKELDEWHTRIKFVSISNSNQHNLVDLRLKLVPADGYSWADGKDDSKSEFTIKAWIVNKKV